MASNERYTSLDDEKQESTADDEEDGSDFIPGSSNKKQENTAADEEYGSDFIPGSSNKTTEKDVLRTEASYVDSMKFTDMVKMLEVLHLDVPESKEGCKQHLKEHLFSGQRRELHSQKMLNMVQKTIKKYMDLKKLIIDQYSKVKDLTEKDMFLEEMEEIMNTRFPNFAQVLETRKELKNYSDEFEIVVIGETSAGKSSFLNVLLGKGILPSHSLHTTSCLCRLHNSVETRLEFTTHNRSETKITPIRNLDELKKTLTEQLKSADQDDEHLAVIDIYWPIPWLQENVVLVDTPGIGERDTLTEQVAEYVPTAAGYIFIVDSSHAGGIQEGGIVKLLQVIQLSADKTGSQITDPSNLLFLCNKWDRVEQDDRDAVSQNTQDKLTKYCGPLQDWQAMKFNAKVELKLQEWKANPTEAFEILVGSLEKLMIKTIDRRLGEKFQWILNFVAVLHSFVDARVESLLMSETELDEKLKKSKESLVAATSKLKEYDEVERLVTAKGEELVNNLRRYLESTTGRSKLLDWSLSVTAVSDLNKDGPQLVLQRFQDVILEWADMEPGSLMETTTLIKERCRKIQEDINSSFDSINVLNFDSLKEKSIESKIRYERMSFIVRILSAYFRMFGLVYRGSVRIMRNTTKKALNHLLGKPLDTFISCSFRDPWQKQLNALKKDVQNKIDSSYTVLREIQKDRKRKYDILNQLSCLKTEVMETLKCLQALEGNIQSTNQF